MRKIDVHEVIDNARFNRFHWMVLFWCALIIIFDGYDLVIYGVVLPMLMKEWGLSPLQAGALGSYALFGMMFGALFFGPLSDRIAPQKSHHDLRDALQWLHRAQWFRPQPHRVRPLSLHCRARHWRRDA